MTDSDEPEAITLTGTELRGRTCLLGNAAGFVLHLPADLNTEDRTLVSSKWFGAASFGKHYLSVVRTWVVIDEICTPLDRRNQTGFIQDEGRAIRRYEVSGIVIEEELFVPDGHAAVALTLSADRRVRFILEPQFDMRYYQALNTAFSGYAARVANESLFVTNHLPAEPPVPALDFACVAGADGPVQIDLLPPRDRLRLKRYLVDEKRQKLIHAAYVETQEATPDEAPMWESYETTVYAPARISGDGPLTLLVGFGSDEAEAGTERDACREHLPALRASKREQATAWLSEGALSTGRPETDRAYAQILTRFNTCLVARDTTVRYGEGAIQEHYSAIFAGDKYFLDAWKRDENISLGGLLATNDYTTVRAILADTWQHQDERTGRLPHIIRLGQPLVYYSSDGTLWALRRLAEYTRASGDGSLLDAKYAMVERFFRASLASVARGLLPSGGIVDKAYRWETWEDTPYTPRDGYPVEIELLWLAALRDYLPCIGARAPDLAERLRAILQEGEETFKLFHLDGYLADSLSYDWEPRPLLTPNGYLAFSLGHDLPPDLARSMVMLARQQLAGQVGVRSLAPRDWPKVFPSAFVDDPHNFRRGNMVSVGIYNYHRGIEWLWLNQFMVYGERQYGDADHAYDLYVHGLQHETLHQGGIGGLSELFDANGPLGADFQAWSMTDFVVCLHAFAGIEIDAPARRLRIAPIVPHHFPHLTARRRAGNARFDMTYMRPDERTQHVDVHFRDPIPNGLMMEVSVRVPPDLSGMTVTVNGEAVPGEQVGYGGGNGTPRTAGIQLQAQRDLTVRFRYRE